MKPFLQTEQSKSNLHWYAMAGVGLAFVIWYLDLVPRIRFAATGTIVGRESDGGPTAQQANHPSAEAQDSAVEIDGDGGSLFEPIVDRRGGDRRGRDRQPDPSGAGASYVDRAIAAQASPIPSELPEFNEPQGGEILQVAAVVSTDTDADSDTDTDAAASEIGGVGAVGAVGALSGAADEAIAPVISAALAEQLRQIDQDYRDGRIMDAHSKLSQIYWKAPESRAAIRDRIEHTAFLIFVSPEHRFSEPRIVAAGETLGEIASEYRLTADYLAKLNRLDPNHVEAGQALKVVKGPFSAVVDVEDFAMTVHAHGWYVRRYAIGTGANNKTPIGSFKVEEKLENPVWYNPDGGIIEADDPANPLGEYWLGLGNHIGIHGTIDPQSIGQAVSRGCIHLGDGDIEEVFGLLTTGSEVRIRRRSYK